MAMAKAKLIKRKWIDSIEWADCYCLLWVMITMLIAHKSHIGELSPVRRQKEARRRASFQFESSVLLHQVLGQHVNLF